MQEEPPRFDPMRAFGRAVDNAIGGAQDRARGALNAADVAVRGRSLTNGELRMIQDMFGTTAGFARARVFSRNFWWPYSNPRAMAPDGNIYFPSDDYLDDYSLAFVPLGLRALFMHEATHLYQWYVLRQWVMVRGLVDRVYEYDLIPDKALKDYGLEQMGAIVEDYYRLRHGGASLRPNHRLSDYRYALPVRHQ